jgi:predicted glycoside hydrolase/deacetylase ChbG (UPF0249 family)
MKLITQGDDFGITRGVTYGIVDSIDLGLLRNTGLFANMPAAELAVSFMADRPQVCFGIDFNIVTGPCCADPRDVPALVDENGAFIRSSVRIHDPRWATEEGRREMFPYDQVYRELKAQYDRFVGLAGRKPGYLHAHSITSEPYVEAIRQLVKETGIPYSEDLWQKLDVMTTWRLDRKRAAASDKASSQKVFDPLDQLNKDPLQKVFDYSDELLAHDYCLIGGHPGYLDAELLKVTSLSVERIRDAEMMMSPQLKQWVQDNHVEIIRYTDLY